MNLFCYDKKQIEEIKTKWNDMGLPYTCYVLSKGKDNWTLLYMASDDNYFSYYFKEAPVEDILLANNDDEYLFNYLKPKVIQILPNYITIELREKIFKVDRY